VVDANVDPFLLAETGHSTHDFPLLDELYKIFPYEFQGFQEASQVIQETKHPEVVLSIPQGSVCFTKQVRLYLRYSSSKFFFFFNILIVRDSFTFVINKQDSVFFIFLTCVIINYFY